MVRQGFTVSSKQFWITPGHQRKVSLCMLLSTAFFPFQVVDFALGASIWQLQWLCCGISLSTETAGVTPWREEIILGVGPFHALLPSFIWGETCLSTAYTLVHTICLQCYALSMQVLYLCMPRNHSYALQQMFYGSSVISTLHYYARGTDLISCSLGWQRMGVLLRQRAKPRIGRKKEHFSIALQWSLQLMMMIFCALMPFI